MADREKVLNGLEACADHTGALCRSCPYDFRKESCISDMAEDALELLKKQPEIVRCKDCEYWVPGVITDQDDFIPPKCGKYSQMVGHSADDFCSLGRKEVKQDD